jgi:hypothetical protein
MIALACAVVVAACSGIRPEVGREQPRCSTYTVACSVTGSGDCDDCESLNCCATRKGCYNDSTCGCADSDADDCLASTSGAADDPAAIACWRAFAASGSIAQARIGCERAYCAAECQVPSAAALAGTDDGGGGDVSSDASATDASATDASADGGP